MNYKNQIYLITRPFNTFEELYSKTELALKAGVKLLQYRNKTKDNEVLISEAKKLQELCKKYEVTFIINDRLDIAIEIGADGVHLGSKDGSIANAREKLGPDKIVGASAYSVEIAKRCEIEGADYLGVGALYPTQSKDDAASISVQELTNIKNAVNIPIVGIGGINENTLTKDVSDQLDCISVISAIYDSNDIKSSVNNLKNLIK